MVVLESCTPDYPFEIVMHQPGIVMVNLETKLEPDTLEEITLYLYDKYKGEQDAFMVNFLVPSEYPESVGDPWAMTWMHKENPQEDAVITGLSIYGSLNESGKEKLMQSGPSDKRVQGKWYYNSSMKESVYVIYNGEYDTSLFVYRPEEYREHYNSRTGELEYYEPLPAEYDGEENPFMTYKLTVLPNTGEYAYYPDTVPALQITEKGELILLQEIYSFMNSKKPVLTPIAF